MKFHTIIWKRVGIKDSSGNSKVLKFREESFQAAMKRLSECSKASVRGESITHEENFIPMLTINY